MDKRIVKHACIIVDYSLKVKKGESVLIRSNTLAAPLVMEIYKQVIRRGAYPVPHITLPGMNYYFLKNADKRLLKTLYRPQLYAAKYTDKFVSIISDSNTREMTGVDSDRISIRRKTLHPVQETIMKKN